MPPIIRNILAVISGLALGSVVNMGLIQLGMSILPWPESIDLNRPETIETNIHLLETKHFLFPFLAHALGTLVAGFVIAWIAAYNKFKLGLIASVFLIGGIMAAQMIPAPTWFLILDLGFAYLPMAWIGAKLGAGRAKKS
ncbi:MAG: hypothetical protein AAF598_13730 [Bacteroidota bacterium]